MHHFDRLILLLILTKIKQLESSLSDDSTSTKEKHNGRS